jgi:hypothetical protein
MRVIINAELKQDYGLGSAPSELTNQGMRVSYYTNESNILESKTEDLIQSLIDERGAVPRVYCRYAWLGSG